MRRALLVVALSLAITLSGCWDRREIETRGFVLGIAIDKPTAEEIQAAQGSQLQSTAETFDQTPNPNQSELYRMTVQLPILAKVSRQTGILGGGAQTASPVWNLSGIGSSLFAINREFATRTTIPPFYEHVQVIVISADAARDGLNRFTDFLFRDPEMRRRTPILISDQEARSLLDLQPHLEPFSATYLGRVYLNVDLTARIVHRTDVGALSAFLHNGLDFLLPRVVSRDKEVKVAGAAVFSEDKLVGWLNEDEMQAAKWLGGLAKGDWITLPCPTHPPGPITVDINRGETKVKVSGDGSRPVLQYTIEMSGNIAEDLCEHEDLDFDYGFLRQVEAAVAQTMKVKMESVGKKLQQELQSDALQMGSEVERQNLKLWKQIKDQWREIYPTVEVAVKVNVILKLVNLARKSP